MTDLVKLNADSGQPRQCDDTVRSVWLKKITELSWSRALLPASDWLVPRIWLSVAFVFTARGFKRVPAGSANVTMLTADVTDDHSVEQAVATVLDREGRLDIVLNNAGMGIAGPVENTSIEEATRQLEVNFFGAFRVSRAALPAMRSQHSGYIINIGSIGGLMAIPYQAMYSASKFALEGFSEALRMEVRPFGIRVVIIEPGDHKTALTKTASSRNCQMVRMSMDLLSGQRWHELRTTSKAVRARNRSPGCCTGS